MMNTLERLLADEISYQCPSHWGIIVKSDNTHVHIAAQWYRMNREERAYVVLSVLELQSMRAINDETSRAKFIAVRLIATTKHDNTAP